MAQRRFAHEIPALRKKPITSEEFASLKEIGNGLKQHPIPEEHCQRLLEVGYIREVKSADGRRVLALTGAGLKRLVTGDWWMANDRPVRRPG
jgi:hypothetical protein